MTVFGKTVDTARKFTVTKGRKKPEIFDSYEAAWKYMEKNPGCTLHYFVKK